MSTLPPELTRLMNNIRVRVPGAIDSAIKIELFNVLDDFFQKARCWRDVVPLSVQVGRRSYDVESGEPGTITSLVSLVDTNELPVGAVMDVPGTIVLNVDPSTAYTASATVALTVVDPVDSGGYPQIPDWLLLKYRGVIENGVIGTMMSQKNKPYADQTLAVFHMRRFSAGVSRAAVESKHSNLHGGQSWRFPTFAAGHQR